MILGTPLGHVDFVQEHLRAKINSHGILLERIPSVVDLQAAWLILLFCSSSRANFLLRALPPHEFSFRHDRSLRRCLSELLGAEVPEGTSDIASLPLSLGGLGLLSAQRIRHAANWASWSDSLEMVRNRHPVVAEVMVRALEVGAQGSTWKGQQVLARSWSMRGLMLPDGTISQEVSDHLLHLVMTRQLRNTGGRTWPHNR